MIKLILNQICAMINVVLDAKNQSLKLCSADGLDMVGLKHLFHFKIPQQIIRDYLLYLAFEYQSVV